jgi:nucleoside phosphorylase
MMMIGIITAVKSEADAVLSMMNVKKKKVFIKSIFMKAVSMKKK